MRDMMLAFDSTGRLLGTIGRRGAGPGEFVRISVPILGRADSIYVHDFGLGRVSVIGPDLQVARSFAARYRPWLVRDDGTFVVAEQIGTPEHAGYPLHVVDETGKVLRSFGTESPQYRSDLRLLLTRFVAPARDGTIWAVAPGRYVIERWDPERGVLISSVPVRSSWFREAPNHLDESERPVSIILGLWEDEAGWIWVLARVADLQWSRPPPLPPGVWERQTTMEDRNGMYDWMVEVIDPGSGTVLASRRFGDYLRQYPPTPLLLSEGPERLDFAVDVWRAVLETSVVAGARALRVVGSPTCRLRQRDG
jgi:hypothetical protein